MPKYIDTPSGIAEFPDEMDDSAIQSVLQQQFPKPDASAVKGLVRTVLGQQFKPPAVPKPPDQAAALRQPKVNALAPLPNLPKPALPFGLRVRSPREEAELAGMGGIAPADVEGARRMAESQAAGAREAIEGTGQLFGSGQPLEKRILGVSRMYRGGMQAAAPVLAPAIGAAAIAAPAATAWGMLAGTAAQEGAERGLKAMGVPEGYARAAGDIAGLPVYAVGPFRALRPKVPTGVADDLAKAASRVDDAVPERAILESTISEDRPVVPDLAPPTSRTGVPPIAKSSTGSSLYLAPDFSTRGAVPQATPFPFYAQRAKAKKGVGPAAWVPPKPKKTPAAPAVNSPSDAPMPDAIPVPEATDGGLPSSLSGAKPRYGYGEKKFTLAFEDDIDKAAYIASSKKPSKSSKDYMTFAMESSGLDESGVKAHGLNVRNAIKGIAKDSPAGDLKIPSQGVQRATIKSNAPAIRDVPEPPRNAALRPDPADAAPQPKPADTSSTRSAADPVATIRELQGGDATAPVTIAKAKAAGLSDQQIVENLGPGKLIPHESHLHPDAPEVKANPERFLVDGGKAYAVVVPDAPAASPRRETQRGAITIPSRKQIKQVKESLEESFDRTFTNLVDRYHPLRRLEEIGGGVSSERSPYMAARSHGGHQGQIMDKLIDLRRVVRPAKKEGILDDAIKYAILERHQEKFGQLPDYTAPGYSDAAAVDADLIAMRQSMGPDRLKKVDALNAKMREYSDGLMQYLRDNGVISKESYDTIKANNEKYIPFQRVEYMQRLLDSDDIPYGSNAFSVADSGIRALEGSEKEIADPLTSLVKNTQSVFGVVSRNDVARKVAWLANDPAYKGIVIPLHKPGQPVAQGFKKVSYLENGIKKQVAVPEGIDETLRHVENVDIITRAMSVPTRILRALVTLDPTFMRNNVFRDYQTAIAAARLNGFGFTPVDWAKGFAAAVTRGIPDNAIPTILKGKVGEGTYREFLRSKGAFGGFYHHGNIRQTAGDLTEHAGKKVLRTVVNPAELMRAVGENMELAPRLGVFMKAQKQGATPFEAGFKARNSTVDFERRGASMKAVSMMVPFLNARIQGTVNLYSAAKESPVAVISKLTANVGVPWLAAYAANRLYYDDEYNSISDFEKRNNIIVILGKRRDADGNLIDAIKIPKGEVGPYLNTVEDIFDHFNKKYPKQWKTTLIQALSDMSPIPFEEKGELSTRPVAAMVLPPPAKAIVEWNTNQNLFSGRDIVPDSMRDASPANQFKAGTPEYLKTIGKVTGFSPEKIKNTMGTMGGYLGRRLADPEKGSRIFISDLSTVRTDTKDAPRVQRLNEESRRATDLRVSADRTARETFPKMLKATVPERQAIFREGLAQLKKDYPNETNDELVKRYKSAIEAAYLRQFPEKKTPDSDPREVPLNSYERKLRGMSAQTRARVMLPELKSMSKEELREKYRRWESIGLITPKVIEEMRKIK